MPSLPCYSYQRLEGWWRDGRGWAVAYLLGLERVVGCLDGHVLVAADLDAVCDDALGIALVVEGIGDGFALSVGDLAAGLY